MIDFIANNYGSIITGAIVLTVLTAIAVKLIRDKKSGKGSCSCGCGECPHAKSCRGYEDNE